MGITVAPLTTTVMSIRPTEHSGVASGINNAVTRSAQVLALAILGAVAIFTFSSTLQTRAASLPLSPEQRTTLVAGRGQARRDAPAAGPRCEGRRAGDDSGSGVFVGTFRLLTSIGPAMALVSAALAWLLVESPRQIPQETKSGKARPKRRPRICRLVSAA